MPYQKFLPHIDTLQIHQVSPPFPMMGQSGEQLRLIATTPFQSLGKSNDWLER